MMLEFLRKPYPFNNDLIHNAKVVFFISFVLGLFLYFFEPFNFNEFSTREKFLVSSVIALITFSVLSLNMIVLPSYFKQFFNIRKWNVFKEILWNFWLFISVSVGYYLYFRYANIFHISIKDAATIFLTSIMSISILVMLNQNRLVKLHLNNAIELNKKLLSKVNLKDQKITFHSEYKRDVISLAVNDIRLFKSAGNYVEIYYVENGKTKKHLIRTTLKKIEEQLMSYSCIYRCHRRFIVNTDFIEQAEGDPQGVKIRLKNLDFSVPVSTNYIKKLKEII